MSDAKEKLAAAMADLGVTVQSVFVPWSESRHKGERAPSLNWLVTVQRHGRDVLTTQYSAGMAHCPGYTRYTGQRHEQHTVCQWECEHGYAGHYQSCGVTRRGSGTKSPRLTPDSVSVLWSLSQDAAALDCPSYEEFATEFGYDEDSRHGEAVYRACLEIALKLRAGLGEAGLAQLRDAGEGY